MEAFQGDERPVIILSCVRSDIDGTASLGDDMVQKLLRSDARHNLGFLHNRKRFNVSITRAQALLVVVGNPFVLQHDPFWRALLTYSCENNCYAGAEYQHTPPATPGSLPPSPGSSVGIDAVTAALQNLSFGSSDGGDSGAAVNDELLAENSPY